MANESNTTTTTAILERDCAGEDDVPQQPSPVMEPSRKQPATAPKGRNGICPSKFGMKNSGDCINRAKFFFQVSKDGDEYHVCRFKGCETRFLSSRTMGGKKIVAPMVEHVGMHALSHMNIDNSMILSNVSELSLESRMCFETNSSENAPSATTVSARLNSSSTSSPGSLSSTANSPCGYSLVGSSVTEVSPRTNISTLNLASAVGFGGASDDPSSNPRLFLGSIVKDAVAELLAERNFVVSAKKMPSNCATRKAKKTSGECLETPAAVHRGDHTDTEGQSRVVGDDDNSAALPKKGRAASGATKKKPDGKATRSKRVTKKAAESSPEEEVAGLPPPSVQQNVGEECFADCETAIRRRDEEFVSVSPASTEDVCGVADVSGSLAPCGSSSLSGFSNLLDVDFAVLKVAEEGSPNTGTMMMMSVDGVCHSSAAIPEADADSAKNAAAYDLVRRLGMLSSLRSQESN